VLSGGTRTTVSIALISEIFNSGKATFSPFAAHLAQLPMVELVGPALMVEQAGLADAAEPLLQEAAQMVSPA